MAYLKSLVLSLLACVALNGLLTEAAEAALQFEDDNDCGQSFVEFQKSDDKDDNLQKNILIKLQRPECTEKLTDAFFKIQFTDKNKRDLNEFLGIIARAPKAAQAIKIGKFFTTTSGEQDFTERVHPFRNLSNWPILAGKFSPEQLKAIDGNFFLQETIFSALGEKIVLDCDRLFSGIEIERYQDDKNSFYLDFFANNKELVKKLFYNESQCKKATKKTIKTLINKKSAEVLAEVPGCVESIPSTSFAVKGEVPLELPKEVLRLMKAKQLEEYIYDQKNCVYLDLSVMEKKLSGVKVDPLCFFYALTSTQLAGKVKLMFTSDFLKHSGNEELFSCSYLTDFEEYVDYSSETTFSFSNSTILPPMLLTKHWTMKFARVSKLTPTMLICLIQRLRF